MQVKFFTIPIKQIVEAEEEANRFLRTRRVLATERRFVENGENSFWALAVEYLDGGSVGGSERKRGRKPRIDYMELLPPEQFTVFAKLRDVRKQLAATDSVPPYVVFTDEQLAAMVTERVDSKEAMKKIPGVGEAKADKYAQAMLAALRGTGTGTARESQ